MKSPNVVWISTHDINPDLGCYAGVWPGAEYALTPNLDRLAAEGARFDQAFASAPVCAPARSAIVTGCFPTAIGTTHMRTKAIPSVRNPGTLRFKAWRLGFRPSEESWITVPSDPNNAAH